MPYAEAARAAKWVAYHEETSTRGQVELQHHFQDDLFPYSFCSSFSELQDTRAVSEYAATLGEGGRGASQYGFQKS